MTTYTSTYGEGDRYTATAETSGRQDQDVRLSLTRDDTPEQIITPEPGINGSVIFQTVEDGVQRPTRLFLIEQEAKGFRDVLMDAYPYDPAEPFQPAETLEHAERCRRRQQANILRQYDLLEGERQRADEAEAKVQDLEQRVADLEQHGNEAIASMQGKRDRAVQHQEQQRHRAEEAEARVNELEAKLAACREELDIMRRERDEEVSHRQEETRRSDQAEQFRLEAGRALEALEAQLEELRRVAIADEHRVASAEALADARLEHIADLRAALEQDRRAFDAQVLGAVEPIPMGMAMSTAEPTRLKAGDPDPGHGVTVETGLVRWEKVEGRDVWAPAGQTQPAYSWDLLVNGFPNGLEVVS